MTLPYCEPLTPRAPAERVIPEPPRRGEAGGEPCAICSGGTTSAVWSDDLWTLHPPVGGSLPGSVWLASRAHVDSFCDLPAAAAADFGRITANVERAILSLGGIARVHLYRWGDGGAHFHVWFIPRPLGMLEAHGMMLPLWEDVLPNVPDEELKAAAERVAAAMDSAAALPVPSSRPAGHPHTPARSAGLSGLPDAAARHGAGRDMVGDGDGVGVGAGAADVGTGPGRDRTGDGDEGTGPGRDRTGDGEWETGREGADGAGGTT